MKLETYLSENAIRPTEFARRMGVAHTTVMRWASGEVAPSLDAMERIAAETQGAVMPNDFMRASQG